MAKYLLFCFIPKNIYLCKQNITNDRFWKRLTTCLHDFLLQKNNSPITCKILKTLKLEKYLILFMENKFFCFIFAIQIHGESALYCVEESRPKQVVSALPQL